RRHTMNLRSILCTGVLCLGLGLIPAREARAQIIDVSPLVAPYVQTYSYYYPPAYYGPTYYPAPVYGYYDTPGYYWSGRYYTTPYGSGWYYGRYNPYTNRYGYRYGW